VYVHAGNFLLQILVIIQFFTQNADILKPKGPQNSKNSDVLQSVFSSSLSPFLKSSLILFYSFLPKFVYSLVFFKQNYL
jgi:hypothetical protein